MKSKEEIQAMLDEKVNTLLGAHRGRVDVVDVQHDADHGLHLCFVKMSGGCQGCKGAKYTLNLIVNKFVKEFDPSIEHVIDSTDHTAGTNPFYKE